MNKKLRQLNGQICGLKIMAFALVLALLSFIGLLWFLRPSVSEVEKRTLTEFPELTWSGFWDGSFFHDVDTWYADTYPLRESMIAANQSMETLYGLRGEKIVGETMVADEIPDASAAAAEVTAVPVPSAEPSPEPEEQLEDGTVSEIGELQGGIYITQNAGYGLYYFLQSGADQYAATMNQVYQNIKDKVNMYVMVAPISAGVMLDDTVLADMGCSDEGDAIEYIYGQLDDGIRKVNVYDNLRKHNAEYIYFRTDHHWTQLGAYYAYEMFCQEKGIEPHDLEEFESATYEGFLGTFYSYSEQAQELADNPDTLTTWTPMGTNEMILHTSDGAVMDWPIVIDVSGYDKTGLYGAYVGGDRPFSYAHNENITDGSAVLLVKDSYGNAFVPWLIDHYEYIYWIDYRYTSNTVSQMVEDYGIQDVIFECSIYKASTTDSLSRFAYVGQ